MTGRMLCHFDEVPDGGAKGVETGSGDERRDIILLRRGEKVFAYVNRCPHMGTPLETFPDKFLDQTGELLICSTHGARFRVENGLCVGGPCKGASLESVRIRIKDDEIHLEAENFAEDR